MYMEISMVELERMKRKKWRRQTVGGKLGSHNKRTRTALTLIVCSINVGIGICIFHFFFTPLYIFQYNNNGVGFMYRFVKFSADQLRKIEESIRIRKAYEPVELMRLVKEVEKEMYSEETILSLPKNMKQKIRDELIERLKGLDEDADWKDERGVLENWRDQKLKEAKQVVLGHPINSTLLPEEAGLLIEVLESHWVELSEELGFSLPTDVDVDEHEDQPEDAPDFEKEEEILPGRELPRACHAELHSHYDGVAIRWGHTYHKQSAFECCQACYIQADRAEPGELKCNVWVYCPSIKGCYFPDVYQHKHMECWLKYSENPRPIFRGKYPESYREAHPGLPEIVRWVSGTVNH